MTDARPTIFRPRVNAASALTLARVRDDALDLVVRARAKSQSLQKLISGPGHTGFFVPSDEICFAASILFESSRNAGPWEALTSQHDDDNFRIRCSPK